MLVATTKNIAGHRTVETKGTCFGVVVRSRGLGERRYVDIAPPTH